MTCLCEMARIEEYTLYKQQLPHNYTNLVELDELLVMERTGHWSTQEVRIYKMSRKKYCLILKSEDRRQEGESTASDTPVTTNTVTSPGQLAL